MCRNIRPLFNFDPPATSDEVHAAALQYVRKISGSTKPSRVNEDAFMRAVAAPLSAPAPPPLWRHNGVHDPPKSPIWSHISFK